MAPALAQTASAGAAAAEIPPILFVHGNGDHAALWITTLWRMESNGVPRGRMFAINFTDPLARGNDAVAQENQRTGAARVALVGNSRGGYPMRNVVKNGGGADVSQAVLCRRGRALNPAKVDPSWYLEMVLTSPGPPITHFYRSPFPRSSDVVHLRPAKALGPADATAGSVIIMTSPRGYFGVPRDLVLLEGKEPADVKPGCRPIRPPLCGFPPEGPGGP